MPVTIVLPDPLGEVLQQKAEQMNLSIDETAATLLDSLLSSHPPVTQHPEDAEFTLEEVVARIKATPPNPAMVRPASKPVSELLAELEHDPPAPAGISPSEWDRLWGEFEWN